MSADQHGELGELRLFLEEICCELCRYRHVAQDGLVPEQVETMREVRLALPGAFADIKVTAGELRPYFVEIKWGYEADEFINRLARKYAEMPDGSCRRLIVVTDLAEREGWPEIDDRLRQRLCPDLEIEIWSESEIRRQIEQFFGLQIEELGRGNHHAIRDAIIRAEWRHAFGDAGNDRLAPTLLWHFSAWRLSWMHRVLGLQPNAILRAGTYRNLVIVMADLCSFSSYVRDTNDDAVVRQALTAFYSQARQAVLECSGMIDKFVGDEVIGVFGYPSPQSGYADDALRCAHRLIDIGNSVSEHWQARLDRAQESHGVHIGIAVGDLNFLPLRAFSSSHFGFIGDALNVTARLMTIAGPSEIVISNKFYREISADAQSTFEALAPTPGKNVGLIQCWRRRASAPAPAE